MKFSQLPTKLRVYLLGSVVAAGVLLPAAWQLHGPSDPVLLGVLLVLAAVAGGFKVELTIRWGRMSLGFAVAYFTLLALGVPQAALVNAVTALAAMSINRTQGLFPAEPRRFGFGGIPLYRVLFNLSNHALSVVAAGLLYRALNGEFGSLRLEHAALPVLGSTAAYYLVNTVGTATAVAWSQRMPALWVWRQNFLWTAPSYLVSSCGAAALALLYQRWGMGVLLFFPPFYSIYYSYRLYMEKIHSDIRHIWELNELNSSVIASLAMAIDAKDRYTHSHVNRVREVAVAIAERLRLSPDELEAVKIAALLHDIGKLGVPEHILSKPGKLTREEFEIVKTHVTIGAMILEPVRFPWPVIPIVRSHHERWDGNGYPDGLMGEQIPAGARIVALADVYDALTSVRPYRKAMPREKAVAFIEAGSGTQFDPRVVEAFLAVLPELEERMRQMDLAAPGSGLGAARTESPEPGARRSESGAAPTAHPQIAAEALEQIARANEETLRLSELTDLITTQPELGSTLELIGEKVAKLLPCSTCAIFLTASGRGELEPVYARGLSEELFAGMKIQIGEGASGWVVEQNEAVLNGSASLDVARKLKPNDDLELASTLSVPLMGEGRVIGALTLYHTSYNFYKPHHLRLLTLIAEHAGPAVERARQFARTRQLALEDTLTGLPNARALMRVLNQQISECERYESEFVILLADLDNFKQINDQFGHLEGDRVLEQVSRMLQAGVRRMDFVARYAGDEFVIVLPDAGLDTAEEIIRRVRAAVESVPVRAGQLPLGISIGQAVYPADGTDLRRLLGVADGRMYADKSQRRRQEAAPDEGRLAVLGDRRHEG